MFISVSTEMQKFQYMKQFDLFDCVFIKAMKNGSNVEQ
jgi:hypothetical protein